MANARSTGRLLLLQEETKKGFLGAVAVGLQGLCETIGYRDAEIGVCLVEETAEAAAGDGMGKRLLLGSVEFRVCVGAWLFYSPIEKR